MVAPAWELRPLMAFANQIAYARRSLIRKLGSENPRVALLCAPLAELLSDVKDIMPPGAGDQHQLQLEMLVKVACQRDEDRRVQPDPLRLPLPAAHQDLPSDVASLARQDGSDETNASRRVPQIFARMSPQQGQILVKRRQLSRKR